MKTGSAILELDSKHLHACHECDLLICGHEITSGNKSVCPRCGALVAEHKPDSIDRTLACVITGLILYWPANFLPILSLNILGNSSYNTMIGAVEALYRGGLPLVGLMVLFCSVLAPFINLFVLLAVLLQVKANRCATSLPALFRLYIHLDSWAMLEIYMLALLVAIIKLLDIARVQVDIGIICFIGLLLANLMSKVTLDKNNIWKQIERLCQP